MNIRSVLHVYSVLGITFATSLLLAAVGQANGGQVFLAQGCAFVALFVGAPAMLVALVNGFARSQWEQAHLR